MEREWRLFARSIGHLSSGIMAGVSRLGQSSGGPKKGLDQDARNASLAMLFAVYAIGFGVLSYFLEQPSVMRALIEGLIFAVLLTAFQAWRARRAARRAS